MPIQLFILAHCALTNVNNHYFGFKKALLENAEINIKIK